jgi:hypothetical protein
VDANDERRAIEGLPVQVRGRSFIGVHTRGDPLRRVVRELQAMGAKHTTLTATAGTLGSRLR